jgi:hypothetical protein
MWLCRHTSMANSPLAAIGNKVAHLGPRSYCLSAQMLFMSTGWDYVSELRPPTGLLFIPKIYEYRATVGWYSQVKTEEFGEKPAPVLLCPPQIPDGVTRELARASAVRGRRVNDLSMTRSVSRDSERVYSVVFRLEILKQFETVLSSWWLFFLPCLRLFLFFICIVSFASPCPSCFSCWLRVHFDTILSFRVWDNRTLGVALGFCARASYSPTCYVAFLCGWSAKWWSWKVRFMFAAEHWNLP